MCGTGNGTKCIGAEGRLSSRTRDPSFSTPTTFPDQLAWLIDQSRITCNGGGTPCPWRYPGTCRTSGSSIPSGALLRAPSPDFPSPRSPPDAPNQSRETKEERPPVRSISLARSRTLGAASKRMVCPWLKSCGNSLEDEDTRHLIWILSPSHSDSGSTKQLHKSHERAATSGRHKAIMTGRTRCPASNLFLHTSRVSR